MFHSYILQHEINTQWSLNISQLFMYETIVKYVIQGLEFVEQGINPICYKFHIFPKMIKGIPFPERKNYYFSLF